jgi:V8-like Glu-specific endopeptidase
MDNKDYYTQGLIGGGEESYIDELEGIVNNEPKKNKYEVVKFHKLNMFPYFLVGKVVSKFDFDGTNKYLNGVGILVGPDIVLTVAHNLCHMTSKDKILITKKVCFFAAANGDFNLFDPVKSVNTYIPDAYIESLKTENRDEQLHNDWGLIFLSTPIGDHITQILDIDKHNNYIKLVDQFYNFFVNNEGFNLTGLTKLTQSDKISIVGYTEYKETYKNNSAYKYIKNFTNNEEDTNKILKDIVEGDTMKDKKININININTDKSEGMLTKGGREMKANGTDYIVLGKEEFNKDFDTNDIEKLIMCESKGNIIGMTGENMELDLKAIRYKISTYKGQSGSPIFIRSRIITEKDPNMKNKPQYIYKFIGLHSRRGPSSEFYESEKLNNLTENLMTGNLGNAANFIKVKPQNKNSELETAMAENDIVKQNGICEYNMALSIMGDTIKTIKDIITKENSLPKYQQLSDVKSDFVMIKIMLNGEQKLNGLFKRNISMASLFNFGSKIFNVPKEFILLKDIAYNNDIAAIHNFNFDSGKRLTEILKDEECSSKSFELMLNIKKYGEIMSNNILQKFLENYDLEEKQLRTDFNKYTKALFHSIFAEIHSFETVHPTYGKLFKKIRKTILAKLNILS